ncbi:MAG: type II secretion system F family protein [Actinomycetota bacterium]
MNRRKLLGSTAGTLAVLVGLMSGVAASTVSVAGDPGLTIEDVDVEDFPQIELTVGVSGGLEALEAGGEEFTLLENGKSLPFELLPLENAQDLNVVIVFDRSGSMGNDPMQAAKDAALAFVNALPPEVGIGLVSFSTDATVELPISQDRTALTSAIEVLDSDGRTSLYDGVILASSLFEPTAKRKVLVVLSDGGDNDSAATLEAAVQAVAGLSVEMIELATPESNRAALDLLAAPLPVRSTADPAQLQALYESVAQKLTGRLTVRYDSVAEFGSLIAIQLTLGSGDRVRTASVEVDAPVAPTTLPAIVRVEQTDVGGLSAAQIMSFLLICGGILLATYFATDKRLRLARQRLIPQGTKARMEKKRDPLGSVKQWIETSERQQKLISDIDTLGLNREPGSVIVSVLAAAVFMGLLFTLVGNLVVGLVVAFMVLMAARARLNSKVARRKADFIAQLPETLGTMSSMLRTGYGLTQALGAVAEESMEPTKSLLNRVILEVGTGRDLIESLRAMASQLDSIDFDWVIAGIEISRETGGDLAKTMDTVADTIRERDKLRGQIRALTAEGRFSSYIMLALPPGVGLMSYIINPEFYSIFTEQVGVIMLGITGFLMVAGYFWMQSMISKVSL